jgi:hypothetical protein
VTRIEQFRAILDGHTAAKVEGYLVDAFTASMLVQVYDALDREGGLFERKPEMRERFETLPLMRLVEFGWKQVKA